LSLSGFPTINLYASLLFLILLYAPPI
jgi:hypothetical protein